MTSDIEFKTLRRDVRKRLNLDPKRAMLGDADGTIYEDYGRGLVRVREETAAGFSLEKVVRFRGDVPLEPGWVVNLGYDEDGELAVLNGNFLGQIQRGASPFRDNANDTNRQQFVNQSQITTLLSHLPADQGSEVVVQPWIYARDGVVNDFRGERVDLSSYWPGTGLHRVAGLFLDRDNNIEVVTSAAQNTLDPLTMNDIQELHAGASLDAAPVWAWKLSGVEGTITLADSFLDMRNIMNVPPRSIFTQTVNGSLVNSAAEQSIIYAGIGSQTLTADYFKVGRHIAIGLRGHITSAATPGTLALHLRAGSTNLASAVFGTLNGAMDDDYFEAQFDIVCQSAGVSGAVVAGGKVEAAGLIAGAVTTGQTTLDTTTAQVIDVLAAWETADNSNELITQITSIKEIK